jgi:quinol-cytochrome oxidoreductase complex cytochrome b subunit
MHYTAEITHSFASVEHIMRNVQYGWFIRYLHSNGASAFFFIVYIHIFRGLIYQSFTYENKNVWFSGIIIFVLMMATAFIGYVLPWGQMSFWGATVITNLVSIIPFIGTDIVYWLWGGFSVSAATLSRFYSFHYFFPFVIVGVTVIHLFYLHIEGSSNSFSFEHKVINIFQLRFFPFFLIKDTVGLLTFSFFFFGYIFYAPNALGHSDNYIEANSLVTPEHIVPEWYFLPYYAILRSIPNKIGGIIAMGCSLIIFFFIPFLTTSINYIVKNIIINLQNIRNAKLYIDVSFITIIFVNIFVILGFIGGRPVEEPYLTMGFIFTFLYFSIIFIIPVVHALVQIFIYNKKSPIV